MHFVKSIKYLLRVALQYKHLRQENACFLAEYFELAIDSARKEQHKEEVTGNYMHRQD